MQPAATPAGFIQDAVTLLAAAEFTLNRATGPSLPVYFLLARSIELSLKAFLLDTGMSPKELAGTHAYGHNLFALHAEALKRNISAKVTLDRIEVGVLDLLSKEYVGTKLGYRISGGTYLLPLIDATEQVARKLVHVLEFGAVEINK